MSFFTTLRCILQLSRVYNDVKNITILRETTFFYFFIYIYSAKQKLH